MPTKATEIYHSVLLAARGELAGLAQAKADEIAKAYAGLLQSILKRVEDGRLDADRAARLAASMQDALTAYGKSTAAIINSGVLNGAQLGSRGHQYAIAKLMANARIGVDFGSTFDEIPVAAIESIVARRGLTGTYAEHLVTIQKRRLEKIVDTVDQYLINAVGQGVSAREATHGLVDLMSPSVDAEARVLARYMGSRGGFKIKAPDYVLKFASDPKNRAVVAKARGLVSDARRIAVHEINSAHYEADAYALARSPVVEDVRWQLSGRHPNLPSTPDRCDIYATADYYGRGAGVFPSTALPALPHPHCLCKPLPIVLHPSQWGKEFAAVPEPKNTSPHTAVELFGDRKTRFSIPSAAHKKRVLKERREAFALVQKAHVARLPNASPLELDGNLREMISDLFEDTGMTAATASHVQPVTYKTIVPREQVKPRGDKPKIEKMIPAEVDDKPKIEYMTAAEVKRLPNEPENPIGNVVVRPPVEPDPPARRPEPPPPDVIPAPDRLEFERGLGGSTGAKLYKDTSTGKRYVVKKGASPEHIREESFADRIYEATGANVPKHELFETPDGPVKVAEFIEGESLEDFLRHATTAEKRAIRKQARNHFAVDALLGNWDVAGLDMDNILVARVPDRVLPVIYRIDNGGSLRFRAMGSRKSAAQWGDDVPEIDSLRGKHPSIQPNRGAEWLFSGMGDKAVLLNIQKRLKDARPIVQAVAGESDLQITLAGRISSLRRWADETAERIRAKEAAKATEELLETAEDLGDDAFGGDFLTRVHRGRSSGASTLVEGTAVEDNQVLGWWRRNADGDAETLVQFKLRDSAAKELERRVIKTAVRNSRGDALPATAKGVTADMWSTIERIRPGNHVPYAALQMIDRGLAGLRELQKKGFNIDLTEWDDVYQELLSAMAEGRKPILPSAPPRVAGVRAAGDTLEGVTARRLNRWEVVESRASMDPDKLEDGGVDRLARGTQNDALSSANSVEPFLIEHDDFEIRFVPTTNRSSIGKAFEGLVEIKVSGRPTPRVAEQIREAFNTLGLSSKPPTPEFQEALYLFRTMFFRRDAFPDSKRRRALRLLEEGDRTDGERLRLIKTLYESTVDGLEPYTKAALTLPANKRLRELARGYVPSPDGTGYRYWDRYDLPEQELKLLGQDIELTHSSHGGTAEILVKSMTRRGGLVSSTLDRARMGVSLRFGASPNIDLNNGPGQYFFTQILVQGRSSSAYGPPRLVFHPRALKRLDAISANGDFLNGQSQITNRVRETMNRTGRQYAQAAAKRRNETLFKNGFSLYDVHSFITYSKREKDSVVRMLTEWHGADRWPDGRRIADIVEIRTAK